MSRGIYKHKSLSEEHKRKLKESHIGKSSHMKGKHHTEETKKKLSKAHMGHEGYWNGKHRSKETRIKISEALKGKPSARKGKHLSEETKRRLSEINKGNRHSKETKLKMSKAHKGSKSYLWKGGISPIYNLHRQRTQWKEMVKKVYKRDNYQCQLCGAINGGGKPIKLHSHHIIPWRVSHSDKMNNLITLCNSCHPKIESKWWQYAPMFFEMLGIYKTTDDSDSLF